MFFIFVKLPLIEVISFAFLLSVSISMLKFPFAISIACFSRIDKELEIVFEILITIVRQKITVVKIIISRINAEIFFSLKDLI